jgi:AmmeMemoRadiSam system protein B
MSVRPRTLPVGWYPGSGQECQSELAAFVAGVKPLPAGTKVFGGVMPHAGWYFSGKLAARVFYLAAQIKQPQVVCIFGGHLGGNSSPLLVQDEAWETPLGDLAMATNMFAPLQQKIACRPESPGDNTIEIQLPMVKYFFPQAKLLAVRAPHSQQAMQLGQAVAQTAQELKLSLLAFGSSDLTHYGPNYGWAPKGYGTAAVQWVREVNDKEYVDHALKMDAPGVLQAAAKDQSSCSAGATAAAISAAKTMGAAKATLVDYYTSYDIRPDTSFVGYAGILFEG